MKFLKKLSIVLFSALLITACSAEEVVETPEETPAPAPTEVEVVEIGNYQPNIEFTKSATTEPENIVAVSSEIPGKIVNITNKVGEFVEAGEIIATLGDSLNTESIDIQADTAKRAYELSLISQDLTNDIANLQLDLSLISAELAQNAYKDAVLNRYYSFDVIDGQRESAIITEKTAELSVESAENNLELAEDVLDQLLDLEDDLEDQIAALPSDSPQRAAIEAELDNLDNQIDAQSTQVDNAELAVELAEKNLEQAENASDISRTSSRLHKNQTNQGIDALYDQYRAATKQLELTHAGNKTQALQSESQTLQSESNFKIARLNQSKKQVKAPISGYITAVNLQQGDTANPGQAIIEISNTESIIAKTSVNSAEAKLLAPGMLVRIDQDQTEELRGRIISISPTNSQVTNKVSVEIEIIAPPSSFSAGTLTKITFTPRTRSAVFIPLNAVTIERDQKVVKIVNESGEIELRDVEVGDIFGDFIEITAGLNKSDKVMTTTERFVTEGQKVKITNGKQAR